MAFFGGRGYREKIIATFTFLGGLYFFLYFITPESILLEYKIKQHHEDISLGYIAVGLLTFGLGIINLLMIHGGRIIYLKKGWNQSIALLGGLALMILFSSLDWREDYKVQKQTENLNLLVEFARAIQQDAASNRQDVPPAEKRFEILTAEIRREIEGSKLAAVGEEADQLIRQSAEDFSNKREELSRFLSSERNISELGPISSMITELFALKREFYRRTAEQRFGKKVYKFLFEAFFISLGSAMFSLLGVYIAAAAYRAFRIKTWESSLMMLAALIVMLGQIPYGTWIYSDMPAIRAWLLEVPNSSVARAITIGASVAGLVLAFRMWFSIESGSFSKRGRK